MAVTVLPQRSGFGDTFSRSLLETFLQERRLEVAKEAQKQREKEFKFEQEQAEAQAAREAANQRAAEMAGRTNLIAFLQQNPQFQQAVMAAQPQTAQQIVSGDPMTPGGLQQRTQFDPSAVSPFGAGALAEQFQQQQATAAQTRLAEAQEARARAGTEQIEAETVQARELFPLVKQAQEAEVALREAQSMEAAASARRNQIEANTLMTRFARDAALQRQQGLLRTSQQLGLPPAAVARMVVGTETFPSIQEMMQEELRAIGAIGTTSEDEEAFAQQFESRRLNRLAAGLGLNAEQQAVIEDTIDNFDTPQDVLEAALSSDTLEDEDRARVFVYLQNRFPNQPLTLGESDEGLGWRERLRAAIRNITITPTRPQSGSLSNIFTNLGG